MKELQSILNAYDRLQAMEGQRLALATVVYVEGSSYRRTGARMLVAENGEFFGGISGGCLEGDALRRAKQALLQAKPSVVRYDTREDDAHQIGVGLGCNGIIDVLISPLERDNPRNPLQVLRTCSSDRHPNILVTITEVQGAVQGVEIGQMFRYQSDAQLQREWGADAFPTALLTDIQEAFQNRKSAIRQYFLNDGAVSCFLEFLPPVLHLILQGGNYDIFPLLRIGKELGWKLTIVAPAKKLNREAFELADAIVPEKTGPVDTDAYTATIIMSHDYRTDLENLRKMLRTGIPYIAMLGPRNRTEKILRELESEMDKPFSKADLDRIYSPAGLDIGALSPEEIALAIIAEVTAVFAGRDGRFLRERVGPIHERPV